MVRTIRESWNGSKGRITLAFDYNNKSDRAIIDKIDYLMLEEQPRCENCVNFYREGSFCGYNACMCKIYGCLEVYSHPHYDMDGSKCGDYKRKGDAKCI